MAQGTIDTDKKKKWSSETLSLQNENKKQNVEKISQAW